MRHQRRHVQHVLEVVEHQYSWLTFACEPGTRGQVGRGAVCDAESFGNCRRHERGVLNRGQPDEQHTARPFVRHRACDLQRQSGLPNAPRADERNQACSGIGQQFS